MDQSSRYDLIVIGAGASGCMAAITAAKRGKSVLLLEKNPSIGKKILATGNGKCNFTNYKLDAECFHGNQNQIHFMLDHYPTERIISLFHDMGIFPVQKNGYVYPASGQSKSMVRALEQEIFLSGVQLKCNSFISSFQKESYGYSVETEEGAQYYSRNLLLSTGLLNSSMKGIENTLFASLNQLNISMEKIQPALCGFYCSGIPFKSISGIRTNGKISLIVDDEELCSDVGELQFTDYGISGIPVFQLSASTNRALRDHKKVVFRLNFIPELSKEEALKELAFRIEHVKNPLNGWFPDKIESFFMNMIPKGADNTTFYQYLSALDIKVDKSREFQYAQTCIGGIQDSNLSDSFVTSKNYEGLYFSGELLNVDGICGGYNLHWAWATGHYVGSIVE